MPKQTLLAACTITILLTAIFIQANSLFNPDISWLMHCAEKLLQGGKYYFDFFENNPPMIIYLSIPPVLLSTLLKINFIITARIYIFLIATGSAWLCWSLGKTIFEKHPVLNSVFFTLLISSYLLLPGLQFGEREHVMFMLVMPYVLLAVLRTSGRATNPYLSTLIGILAGLGFAIKPYFVGTVIFIEIYLMFKRRNIFSWLRIESIIIGFILIAYLVGIFILAPEYITYMIPYGMIVFMPYYLSLALWLNIFIEPVAIYFYVAMGFYLFQLKDNNLQHRELLNILAVALCGFFLSYACQVLNSPYHMVPVLGTASLLILIIGHKYLSLYNIRKKSCATFSYSFFFAIILLGIPLGYSFNWTSEGLRLRNNAFYNHLITYTKQNSAGKPIYFFTTALAIPYPLVDYTNTTFPSRFPGFTFLPSMFLESPKASASVEKIIPLAIRKKFLIDTVTQELQTAQPGLIFIYPLNTWRFAQTTAFDYIKFFSEDPQFREIWKHYYFVENINVPNRGSIEVYKRSKD